MTEQQVCTAKHIDHTAIAVRDLAATLKFYQETFGVSGGEVQEIADQGVKAVLIPVGRSELEIIEPIDSNGGVARFIERRGEGFHHICFEVDDVQGKLRILEARGLELIDKEPRRGLAGMIAFIHPRSTGGVLIELAEKV